VFVLFAGAIRIWAGVHYRHSIVEAERQGQAIGHKALERLVYSPTNGASSSKEKGHRTKSMLRG
jgi:hypothetical protein